MHSRFYNCSHRSQTVYQDVNKLFWAITNAGPVAIQQPPIYSIKTTNLSREDFSNFNDIATLGLITEKQISSLVKDIQDDGYHRSVLVNLVQSYCTE